MPTSRRVDAERTNQLRYDHPAKSEEAIIIKFYSSPVFHVFDFLPKPCSQREHPPPNKTKKTLPQVRSAPLDTQKTFHALLAPAAAAALLLTVERSLSFSVCLRRSGTVTSAAMRTLDPARRTDDETGRIDPAWCVCVWCGDRRDHEKGAQQRSSQGGSRVSKTKNGYFQHKYTCIGMVH